MPLNNQTWRRLASLTITLLFAWTSTTVAAAPREAPFAGVLKEYQSSNRALIAELSDGARIEGRLGKIERTRFAVLDASGGSVTVPFERLVRLVDAESGAMLQFQKPGPKDRVRGVYPSLRVLVWCGVATVAAIILFRLYSGA